jgi:hypothetical protein
MDPIDYFVYEEIIFPEYGGVTGTRDEFCPHCHAPLRQPIPGRMLRVTYHCPKCDQRFEIDWSVME